MESPPPVDFGEELKDAFKPVNAWVSNGIAWLDDIQSFYRERSAIEKEYAAKLNALSRKYFDKKARKSAALTVGDTPLLTPGSLESASLTTWTTILTTTEALAAEHDTLSNALNTQVADVFKSLATRYEDYRKRHESLFARLLAERDSVYSELKKSKVQYDAECKEVEEKRQKVDKSYDASKAKAQKSYQAELVEMNNVKNSYLLQIEVTNRHKQRYFYDDLPEIINSLQDLNETRVAKVNQLWTLGGTLETSCYGNCISHLSAQVNEVTRNIPTLDSGMFLKHNIDRWREPAEFVFEPSPIWHDNPDMVVDEPAQIFLQNLLQKSRREADSLKTEVEKWIGEIQQHSEKRTSIMLDESQSQTEIDVMRALLYSQEEVIQYASKLLTRRVETEIIMNAVGDLARGAQSHSFKSTTFKIPTNCDYCSDRMWGITSKGFTCKDCGFSCHSKCELKVPAICPGVLDKAGKKAFKEEQRSATAVKSTNGSEVDLSGSGGLSRSNTMNSIGSSQATSSGGSSVLSPLRLGRPTPKLPSTSLPSISSAPEPKLPKPTAPAVRRVLAPPPDRYIATQQSAVDDSQHSDDNRKQEHGKMSYTFSADGEEQLTVLESTAVIILEDDGQWMTVRLSDGQEGLVPSSYVEKVDKPVSVRDLPSTRELERVPSPVAVKIAARISKRGPPPPVKPRKKKETKIRALYAYEAQGEDEVGMEVGEEFVVLERDVAGWVKVRVSGGSEGLVPGTFVEDVE